MGVTAWPLGVHLGEPLGVHLGDLSVEPTVSG